MWAGSRAALSTKTFAIINLVLVSLWVATVFAIGRENARRAGLDAEPLEAEPAPS